MCVFSCPTLKQASHITITTTPLKTRLLALLAINNAPIGPFYNKVDCGYTSITPLKDGNAVA